MDASYLVKLPGEVQRMVFEIESAIGREIVVRKRTEADIALVPDASLAFCDCLTSEAGTTVEIAHPGEYPVCHQLVHEILHAYRNLVESVPQLRPIRADRNLSEIASRLENDIEHIYIIPMEISFVPEAVDYWNHLYSRKMSELIPKIRDQTMISQYDPLYEDILRHWVILHATLPGSTSERQLDQLLNEMQIGNQIRHQANAIILETDKAQRLTLALQALSHPIQFFDIWKHAV